MNCEICCTAALADTVTEALPGVPRLVVTRMTVEVGNDTSFQALNDDGGYDERFACLILYHASTVRLLANTLMGIRHISARIPNQ